MKKAMTFTTLVSIIAVLVVLIVLLIGVVYPMVKTTKEVGKSAGCALQLLLRSIPKKASMGLITIKAPPECKVKILKIDESMVKDYLKDAETAVKKYKASPDIYWEVLQYFDSTESSYYEWALDKILADELFDAWAYKALFGSVDTTHLLETSNTCLLCTVISFDKELRQKIRPIRPFIANPAYIGSLGAFMRAEMKGHKLKGDLTDMSYFDWLNNNYQYYPIKEVPYSIGERDEYAIAYAMSNEPIELITGGEVQKSFLEFVPADQLTADKEYFGRVYEACDPIIQP